MAPYGRIVKGALALLLDGDAELADGARPRAFRASGGQIISGNTARTLTRDALARKRGDRFTLTAAGRRQALALSPRTAS